MGWRDAPLVELDRTPAWARAPLVDDEPRQERSRGRRQQKKERDPDPPAEKSQPESPPTPEKRRVKFQGAIYRFPADFSDEQVGAWFEQNAVKAQQPPAAAAPPRSAATPPPAAAAAPPPADDQAGMVWGPYGPMPKNQEPASQLQVAGDTKSVSDRLKAGSEAALAIAREELGNSWFPNLQAVSESAHSEWVSLGQRALGNDEEADRHQVVANAWSQAAAELSKGGLFPAVIEGGLRNVLRTIPDMIVAGRLGGPYAALGLAGVQESNRSLTQGRQAGLSGGKLVAHAATKGALEFALGAVLQKFGLGGSETVAAARSIASRSVNEAWKQLRKTTGHELIEEVPTELGQNLADWAYNVDPNAMSLKNLGETLVATVVSTMMQTGAVSTPDIIGGAISGRARKAELDDINAYRTSMQQQVDQFLKPESVEAWVAANSEVDEETGLSVAEELAAVPYPSRKQWSEYDDVPERVPQIQRKQFADMVRGVLANPRRIPGDDESGEGSGSTGGVGPLPPSVPPGDTGIPGTPSPPVPPPPVPPPVPPVVPQVAPEPATIEPTGQTGTVAPTVTAPTEPPTAPSPPVAPPVVPPVSPPPAPVAADKPPGVRLARRVANHLNQNGGIDKGTFFGFADEEYGGTRAEGKYGPSEAYDAMETAANLFILENPPQRASDLSDPEWAKVRLASLEQLRDSLVSQTNRSGTKDRLQQFSTPPAYSFAVNHVANVGPSDIVLEPSAGTGDLAVHAMAAGAKVYGNEIDPKRADLLRSLGLAGVFTEDAGKIGSILPGKMPAPTVVVMNPPFSHNVNMGLKTQPGTDRQHIDEALSLLAPGGRLVAIVGAGDIQTGEMRQGMREWLAKTGKTHNVRANVLVGRDVYKGYGTTFPTRLLVIDKSGATPADGTLTAKVDTLAELVDTLEGVRNDRQSISPSGQNTERKPSGQTGGKTSAGSQGGGKPGVSVPPATGTARPGGTSTAGTRPGGKGTRSPAQPDVRSPGGAATGQPGQTPETRPGGEQKPGERAIDKGTPKPRPDDIGRKADREPVLEPRRNTPAEPGAADRELKDEVVFEPYQVRLGVKDAKPHPASVVESASMSAVDPPAVSYQHHLPQKLISDGAVSAIQLEAVILAGHNHSEVMSNGERGGVLIGDGTGMGKGREIAAIVRDNWEQGRKKAVWFSVNQKLFDDARRDWKALGGQDSDVRNLSKTKGDDQIEGDSGILFSTYSTLASESKRGKTRIDQVVEWLGEGFDGVIAFDESHLLGNGIQTSGQQNPSQMALTAIDLQDRLPNARVVYVSATAATEVKNLSYAQRLGMWGDGTPFADVRDFIGKIGGAGVAAMESVALSLKAMGKYLARSIAFNDGTPEGTVQYSRIEHKLTGDQVGMYDRLADAWQKVYGEVEKALSQTGATGRGKGRARAAFWSSHQRFFNGLITSLQMPVIIEGIEKDLAAGRSVVLQLTSTGEADQERALSGKDPDEDLDDFAIRPFDMLVNLVRDHFPTQAYEQYIDDNGNVRTRPAVDSDGNPVQDRDAVRMKQELLNDLGQMETLMPDSPLDLILNTFGYEAVAEVTGRGRRVVWQEQADGSRKRVEQKRTKDLSNKAEIASFQDGKKNVLVFSEAGGTGASYHADRTVKNQQPRVHYLVQPGWRAAVAIQGLGRTHRANQKQAPTYVLVHTNLSGQKRFISTIARRLTQLGALTKGQRQASGGGVFSAADNLESSEAGDALYTFYRQLQSGELDVIGIDEFERQTGLKLRTEQGGLKSKNDLPDITQFLNRLLSMHFDTQNRVFDAFDSIFQGIVAAKTAAGTLDQGMETVKAKDIVKVEDREVYRHSTGATARYVKLEGQVPVKAESWSEAQQHGNQGWVKDKKGRVWQVEGSNATETDRSGTVHSMYRLRSATAVKYIRDDKLSRSDYESIAKEDAAKAWKEQFEKAPQTRKVTHHMIAGVLLPIWDRIPGTHPKIMRALTKDGETVLGITIPATQVDAVLRSLGAEVQQGNVDETISEILAGDAKVQLTNGWEIERSKVQGEWRLEITGPSAAHHQQLERAGVILERIGFEYRYFIPIGDAMRTVWDAVTKGRPIARVEKFGDQALGIGGASGSSRQANMPVEQDNKTGDRQAIGARDVIETMEAEFGIKIRFGRLRGKNLRGVYKRVWMMARGKGDESASIDVAAHEIAHGIDQRTDVRSGLSRSSVEIGELKPLDYEPAKGRPSEGFAVFVRGYLTGDIDVATEAPAFYKHFVDWLAKHPDLEGKFSRVKDSVTQWREQGAQKRVRGQRGNIGDRPRAAFMARVRQGINRLKLWGINSNLYGEKYLADLKSRGYNPKKGSSFIDIIKAWNQGAATLAHTALEDGVFTMSGGKVRKLSKSLWETMKGVDPKDYEDWADWAYARHAIESWSQNKNPGITLEDALAVYNEFNGRPGWEEAAQGLTDFNNALIDMAVDVGSLTAAEGKAIKDSYKTYMPLFRLVPENISPEGVGGVGLVDPGKLVKGRKGSGYKIVDPVQATIQKAIRFYDAAAKQAAINEMVRATRKHGANGWMEFVPPRQKMTAASVREALEKAGVPSAEIDALEQAGLDVDAISRIYRPNYQPDPSKPEARILLDGEPQMVMFHVPELYEMVTGMGYFQLPKFLDATLGRLTRWIRLTATSLNPAFIGRNFIRDFDTYLLNRDYGSIKDPAYFVFGYAQSEISRRMGGDENAWVEAWRKYGGQLSGPLSMDRQSIRNAVASAVAGRQKFGVLESIIDMAQVTEAGPRLAEFVGVWKKHGWTREQVRDALDKGELPRDILVEALNASHDVTVDFRRSGTIGRWFTRVIPFFNANVQAVDKNIRTFKDHPGRTLIRVMGQAVIPAIAYWLMHHDEDWYEEREDWMSMFWIVTDDEGNPIGRFPRGHVTGQIAAGVEALLDMMYEDDPERLKSWLPMFLDSLIPPTDVSGVGTAIELGLNKDFRGKPIVSKGLQHLEPKDQASQWNTSLMKAVGQWLNVSPAKLEYAVNDLSGGMYRRLANRVSLVDSWWKGDPLSVADLPLVEGFAIRGEHTKSVDEFYTRSDELNAQRASARLRKESMPEADESAYRRISRTRDLMSELRDAAQKLTPQSDERMAVERMIVGAARFALGKDQLPLYPNPLTATDLPSEVKTVVDDHLGKAAFTVARIAKLRSANDDDKASEKAAELYLEEAGVDEAEMARILRSRLRKAGYGSEAVGEWQRRLRARLGP